MNLQELVARARMLFDGAPKRKEVFHLVNGKKSGKEIAKKLGRSLSSVLKDLQKMRDLELVVPRITENGSNMKKDNSIVYEQAVLLKHLSSSFFDEPERIAKAKPKSNIRKRSKTGVISLTVPSIQQILDICGSSGEDQIHEFKSAGTATDKIAKEIAAMANTKLGGIVFYGVQDDGTIENTDLTKQQLDQKLQNCIKHNVTPTPNVKLIGKEILGYKIILIMIPSWNRKDVHHFQDVVYIRRGTNVFKAKADEARKLHDGDYVV